MIKNKIIIFLISFLCITGIAHSADEWTRTNTALQLTWSAMHILDWSQTREIAKRPDTYYEKVNFILDDHPSVGEVDTLFAATLVGNAAIAYILPHPWREVFQCVSIGIKGYSINLNFHIKIGGGDWF